MSSSHRRSRSGCCRQRASSSPASSPWRPSARSAPARVSIATRVSSSSCARAAVSEAGIGELGQRLAPPQAKRLAQRGRRLRHLARLRQASSLRHQLLEADDVDLIGTDRERIAGFGGDDRARPEGTAQLADLGLQGVSRFRRLPVTPQHVNQPVSTDRLAAMQRQQSQQCPLLGAADSKRHAPVCRLELAEQPHVHCLHPTALTRPPPG